MIQTIFSWNFAFNVVLNSFLTFLSMALLVEFFFFLFRIKEARVKALCRLLPCIKICTDFFLYDFSIWAFVQGLNPLQAQPGTRLFSIYCNTNLERFYLYLSAGIQLLLEEGQTFTFADLILLSVDLLWIKIIVMTALSGSLFHLFKKTLQFIHSQQKIAYLIKNAENCLYPIQNPHLLFRLRKNDCHVIISSEIQVPCAIGLGYNHIIIPEKLVPQLTQDEFEAIIAHELGHLCWYDSTFRIYNQIIQAFFWWIPMSWWLNKLELNQEVSCDQFLNKFCIPKIALADAIVKCIRNAKFSFENTSMVYFIKQNQEIPRLKMILNDYENSKSSIFNILCYVLIFGCMLTLLCGRFWIF